MPAGDKGYQMFRSNLSLRRVVVIVALMLCGGSVIAEDTGSATYVMRGCREALMTPNKDSALSGFCVGTIDGLGFAGGTCFPNEATVEQLTRVVVQYIEARPARMHENFKILALEAMRAAWPCKR
jgi:Rap1a immunity proteins